MNRVVGCMMCGLVLSLPISGTAQTRKVIVYEKTKPTVVQWAVFVPETVETFASRYDKEKTRTGQAQGVIEQELQDAGFQLVTLNFSTLSSEPNRALSEALAAGADYLITGEAGVSRILSSESGTIGGGNAQQTAEGARTAQWGSVNKPETSANIQVRIIRVSDGKLMRTESATSTGSARARQNGAQGALDDATQRLLRTLIPDMEDILREHNRQEKQPPAGLD